MRLGQLARKLEVRPNEIVDFLAKHNLPVENSTNTRLEEEHVALIAQHFSPADSASPFDQASISDSDNRAVDTTTSQQAESEATPGSSDIEPPGAGTEVIKAPKVELSGLKVLGKIDLPEIRKKESDLPMQQDPNSDKESKVERRNHTAKKHSRSTKNPIALQREKEALEANKKREEERRLQKERRTQNYLKKVKAHQPTKPARDIREETEELSAADLQAPPTTWWGKLVKWLTS